MPTHSAVATTSKGKFEAIKVETPVPRENDVLIKVHYAAMIAFDTYTTDRGFVVPSYPLVLGFNGAGTIEKVGSGVTDLKVGDRVIAFGKGQSRHKSMQEYAVEPRTVVAKIPDSLPLEEAVTIPDNLITAFFTLFSEINLPIPASFPATEAPPLANEPILIYGAGSTAGIYAIQLLALAGYRKVLATASPRHHEYLRSLGATNVFDYSDPELADKIGRAAGGDGKVSIVVDAITSEGTLTNVSKLVSSEATVALLLPIKAGSAVTNGLDEELYWDVRQDVTPFPPSTKFLGIRTFNYLQDKRLERDLMPKIVPQLLEDGLIKPNKIRLLDQGTFEERVGLGLELLRNNQIRGEKVVVKVVA